MTEAGGGANRDGVGVGCAQKEVVKVVAWVAGLTLILSALLFTLESRGSSWSPKDNQLSTQLSLMVL